MRIQSTKAVAPGRSLVVSRRKARMVRPSQKPGKISRRSNSKVWKSRPPTTKLCVWYWPFSSVKKKDHFAWLRFWRRRRRR